MKTQVAKQADIRFRVELKAKPWIVIYKVRSSDDTQDYDVTVVSGKVNNCTCKSYKPCYHMAGVQAREDAHNSLARRCRERSHDAFSAEMKCERPIDERGSLNHTQRGFQLMR